MIGHTDVSDMEKKVQEGFPRGEAAPDFSIWRLFFAGFSAEFPENKKCNMKIGNSLAFLCKV